MEPQVIRTPMTREEVLAAVRSGFGDMAKVVVDVRRKMLALGGSLHADGEALLLDDGSKQEDLWGANVYPDQPPERQLEYTALINIRPRQENRTMEIQDPTVQKAVAEIVRSLLPLP